MKRPFTWLAIVGFVGLDCRASAYSTNLRKALKQHNRWEPRIILDVGPGTGDVIPFRLKHHLRSWLHKDASTTHAEALVDALLLDSEQEAQSRTSRKRKLNQQQASNWSEDTLIISVGNSVSWARMMSCYRHETNPKIEDQRSCDVESYRVVSLKRGAVAFIGGNGMSSESQHNGEMKVNLGAVYAAYDILQELGIAFWHPLQPFVAAEGLLELEEGLHVRQEVPHWRSRAFHLHTQHPLELTDVLQGFDVPMLRERGETGPEGVERLAAEIAIGWVESEGRERGDARNWEEMAREVVLFFEWAVAHRLNRVEWILLGNHRWGWLNDSPLRHGRLQLLVHMAHAFGLMVGIDCPLIFQQQHSWVMTNSHGPRWKQLQQVRERVDWIMSAGFDFLSTESGMSEFTHPNDELMLDLLNEFAERVNGTWGKEATVKVHCSNGQFCTHFQDPRTGEPLNFNFLPTYATPKLGVLAHTVQAYALDDPAAGVYANANFAPMMDYLLYEAQLKNRAVHFYPETAYWVNVDIDVPLFLPLYAERRVHDLALLVKAEREKDVKLAGVINFDSGWEWGYWLIDCVMAQASWNPLEGDKAVEGEHFKHVLMQALRPLHWDARDKLATWLAELVTVQYEVLLLGQIDGQPCLDQTKLSGIAYLCGVDTWVELPRRLGLSFTQPNYVKFNEHSDPAYPYVQPLLDKMNKSLASLYEQGQPILHELKGESRSSLTMLEHIQEILDGVGILALRAHQVLLIYAATAPGVGAAERNSYLQESRLLISQAEKIVRRREAHYRAPFDRIASWREGPTAYGFGYLWTVHSLYYFWRDQGQAEGASKAAKHSLCYLNRMDPSEIAVGVGRDIMQTIRQLTTSRLPFARFWADCMAAPKQEYIFPRDL